jgi:hypothetical protein
MEAGRYHRRFRILREHLQGHRRTSRVFSILLNLTLLQAFHNGQLTALNELSVPLQSAEAGTDDVSPVS